MIHSRRAATTIGFVTMFMGIAVSASLGAFDGPSSVPSGLHRGQGRSPAVAGRGTTSVSSPVRDGYRAFRRSAESGDLGLLSDSPALQGLATGQQQFNANPSLARKVYDGEQGSAYLVPGGDRLCLVIVGTAGPASVATAVPVSVQCVHQDLAVEQGMGAVLETNGATTFIGVLPDTIRSAAVVDRTGAKHDIALNRDNGYWTTVSQPAHFSVTDTAGSVRSWPVQASLDEGQPPPPPGP